MTVRDGVGERRKRRLPSSRVEKELVGSNVIGRCCGAFPRVVMLIAFPTVIPVVALQAGMSLSLALKTPFDFVVRSDRTGEDYENNIQVEFSTNDDFMALEATEIERVILNMKDKKAPGIDLIPGEIIRELFYSNKQWLTNIFNHLLKKGIFPNIWKLAKIVLIPKQGKEYSPGPLSSYLPAVNMGQSL
ncbi:hypothetical protein CDAR_561871 [Caerostris darwini]|uniref:Reverse transcriptase n=1 Tax=Caerostris darwini TaxID=1538125 RepID=A0AAV4PD39_9ARAC|nr:hypothetical protein CDAR_561871 [Caerostris darwini]